MGFQKFDDIEVPDIILHCKKCGEIIIDDKSKFCSKCGRRLNIPKEFNEEDFMVKV